MIDDSLFVARGSELAPIVHEVLVAAGTRDVFRALTTEEGIAEVVGVRSLVELRVGGAYEIYFDEEQPPGLRGGEGCQVLAYVPEEMLAVSWNAPPELPRARAKRTWAVFFLSPDGAGGSRLRLVHTGLGEGDEWPAVRVYFERAWPRFLDMVVRRFAAPAAV